MKFVFINKIFHFRNTSTLWLKLEEPVPPDLDEFAELFSRQTREKKQPAKNKTKKDKSKEVST